MFLSASKLFKSQYVQDIQQKLVDNLPPNIQNLDISRVITNVKDLFTNNNKVETDKDENDVVSEQILFTDKIQDTQSSQQLSIQNLQEVSIKSDIEQTEYPPKMELPTIDLSDLELEQKQIEFQAKVQDQNASMRQQDQDQEIEESKGLDQNVSDDKKQEEEQSCLEINQSFEDLVKVYMRSFDTTLELYTEYCGIMAQNRLYRMSLEQFQSILYGMQRKIPFQVQNEVQKQMAWYQNATDYIVRDEKVDFYSFQEFQQTLQILDSIFQYQSNDSNQNK